MADIAVVRREAVLASVAVPEAVERVREAFVQHHRGAWRMPPKVYLTSAPHGDFRAMPAGNDEIAILKWVTSFPGNSGSGLPTVTGILCVSDARTGVPIMLLDASSVTSLRTGAVAAVAATALAAPGARSVGVVGCGANGSAAARCLASAGYRPGVCFDPVETAALSLAGELGAGWRVGTLDEAMACDVVTCVTPGAEPVLTAGRLRPGQHYNMLGADGPGKAEATLEAISQIAAQGGAVFCDNWAQASHAGELTRAVQRGFLGREDVGELGAVLAGDSPGRPSADAVTLFDSTGLAIQDLAIASAVLTKWREGTAEARTVRL
ncbi:MAG: ornithine cyclodeaminase family protein [Acidimicrobiales bacterium]